MIPVRFGCLGYTAKPGHRAGLPCRAVALRARISSSSASAPVPGAIGFSTAACAPGSIDSAKRPVGLDVIGVSNNESVPKPFLSHESLQAKAVGTPMKSMDGIHRAPAEPAVTCEGMLPLWHVGVRVLGFISHLRRLRTYAALEMKVSGRVPPTFFCENPLYRSLISVFSVMAVRNSPGCLLNPSGRLAKLAVHARPRTMAPVRSSR